MHIKLPPSIIKLPYKKRSASESPKNTLAALDHMKQLLRRPQLKDLSPVHKRPPTGKAPLPPKPPPRSSTSSKQLYIPKIDWTLQSDFPSQTSLEDYTIGSQIGKGAYASVRCGFHNPTRKRVAFKIYEKLKMLDPKKKENIRREIKILMRIDHPFIVKLVDVLHSHKEILIALEFVRGCSLHGYLKRRKNRRVEENEAKRIMKQVFEAVAHCHARNITHRDIKLENILLDDSNNIKLIDFGFSTLVPPDKKLRLYCGTPSYMAPEIVSRQEYCGPPADVWALGVLLYALLCGHMPFRGSNQRDLSKKIQSGVFIFPSHVSPNAKHLIASMLRTDPVKRLSVLEALENEWLNNLDLKGRTMLCATETIILSSCSVNTETASTGKCESQTSILQAHLSAR